MPGLIINNLTKSFEDQPVLSDFSLEIGSGEFLVVLGPSGCGKSTLLRLIAGLEVPDRGEIILDDRVITDLQPQQRKVSMVFQNYALYPHMTVYQNLAFPLKVAGTKKNEINKTVRETIALLELEELLERYPSQLSGGQRQRVALGRGLVRQPSIFLLDEPLSNLDAALRGRMRREITDLQKKVGITMVYVTHDQIEALTMADQIVVLKDGQIRQMDTPSRVFSDPVDTFVASFLGSPPINLCESSVASGSIEIFNIPTNIKIDDGIYRVGIRPEHIYFNENGYLQGQIVGIEYIGSLSHYRIACGQNELTVTENKLESIRGIGDPVKLTVDPSRILIFDKKTGQRIR